jgi:N-acetylglucosaminyldiphosphoundecaprenol N-acetyl-beta-D-mannosaminyltransferase
MLDVHRVEVLGVPVDRVTMSEALDYVESMIIRQQPSIILAVNPEKIIRAQQDEQLLDLLWSADLLIPDGIGVVMAARILGLGRAERVPGSELMPKLCERAASQGYTVFLFGASEEVNRQATIVLQDRYPGIHIVGSHHGYVTDKEMSIVIADINKCQPNLLFVALGSPQQELWMARYVPLLKVKVCQGVGGTFDVIAGRVKRAPLLFRSMHLEWLYRLFSQPSRIFRQAALPIFVYQVLKNKFTRRPVLKPTFSVPKASVSRGLSDSGKSDNHREKAA